MKKNSKTSASVKKGVTTPAPVKNKTTTSTIPSNITQVDIPKFLEGFHTLLDGRLSFLTNEYNKFLIRRGDCCNSKNHTVLLLWLKYHIEMCEHEVLQGAVLQNKYLVNRLFELPDEKLLFNYYSLFKEAVWTPRFEGLTKKKFNTFSSERK